MVQLKGSTDPKKAAGTAEGSAGGGEGQGFGVRSYLHTFYQQPTAEELAGAGWLLLPPSDGRRQGLYICRAMSILGLVMLMLGAAGIVLSYTWPKEPLERALLKVQLSRDSDGGVWVPSEALVGLLRDPLREWKLVGLGVFAAGGLILAVSMLIPTLSHCCRGHPLSGCFVAEAGEAPIRIFPAQTIAEAGEAPPSPTEKRVPVMEAIAKVQPDQEQGQTKTRRVSEDELLMAEGEPAVTAVRPRVTRSVVSDLLASLP